MTDVDKDSPDRGNPSLNVSDVLSVGAVRAHATEGTSYRSEDATDKPKLVTKDDQIILFDGVANKILIGRDGSGNWDVKIAEDGVDVLTATDAQLLFSGGRNTLQVRGEVQFTNIAAVTIAPGNQDNSASVDISSLGLTSTPLILAFFSTANNASLGKTPYGGTQVELIGGTGTLNTFSLLTTSHTATNAVFNRRYINNSGGNATSQTYYIAFIVCTQTSS